MFEVVVVWSLPEKLGRAGSADEPLDASARLACCLAPPLEETDCRAPVEAVGGAKRLQILVAEAESQLEALGERHRPDGVGVALAEGRGNRPHGASIPAGRLPAGFDSRALQT